MNVQEMMIKVFQLAGEPSDLCPYTIPGDPLTFDVTLVVPGALPLLSWINQALLRISNWEYPDGSILRFRSLRKSLYFKAKPAFTGTVISATTDSVTLLGFAPNNRDDQFNGWLIEIDSGLGNGQKRLVIDTDGLTVNNSTLTVHQDWVIQPDTTSTFKLYKRFFKLTPVMAVATVDEYHILADGSNEFGDILNIRDITTLQDLAQPLKTDLFTAGILSKGVPSSFMLEGDQITFDVPFDTSRTYEVQYYAHPTKLVNINSVTELTAPFHEAIVQWAVHSLQMRDQDFNGAYATKRDLQELMNSLRNSGEMNYENTQTGVTVWG